MRTADQADQGEGDRHGAGQHIGRLGAGQLAGVGRLIGRTGSALFGGGVVSAPGRRGRLGERRDL